MGTRYEYYDAGDVTGSQVYGAKWKGQTFTPSASHRVSYVRLKLLRSGLPGTLIVGIRDTSSSLPTGIDKCSGTINGNNLTESSDGDWYAISLGAGYALSSGIEYAIVIRATSGTGVDKMVGWRLDQAPTGYDDGRQVYSNDSGGSWDGSVDDQMFEEWSGSPTGVAPTVTTEACTDIAAESLTGNGTITDLGGSAVTQHGHCWSTSMLPTTDDYKTLNGAMGQTGHFTSAITGLLAGTTYYIRAYAHNTAGTSYGSQVYNTQATSIGRRHWWVEGTDFHWFGQDGVEYHAKGVGVSSGDSDIPWWGWR